MDGTASLGWPKNSRHTVRTCFGIRCSTQRAEVIRPSQPSFCTPGRPARNLSVTSLPSPTLRKRRPSMSSRWLRIGSPRIAPSAPSWPGAYHFRSKLATAVSWILPRLWPTRATSSQLPSGSTIRHQARLSSAVPHSTAFLPPAFMATLPPTQEASSEVGSTANTRPARSAASVTRLVTTPASDRMVGTSRSRPGSFSISTGPSASSFSVLITAENGVSGIAPPV